MERSRADHPWNISLRLTRDSQVNASESRETHECVHHERRNNEVNSDGSKINTHARTSRWKALMCNDSSTTMPLPKMTP